MFEAQDSVWMARALRLAARGLYTTSPNPRVGCVLIKDGSIVGEGWHERAGKPHAEVLALDAAGMAAHGATAYVTLEPCSHHGRTPPCADALIAAGVARVVLAVQDPNPKVAGEGISKLRAAGIEVEIGLMEDAARELNIGFFARMTRGIPWLRSKIAMSLDGRTALANGTSKWITGEEARLDVQHWRARSCAVLTGIDTILADDPQMNVRDVAVLTRWGEALECGRDDQAADCASKVLIEHQAAVPRQPLRVVLDSRLRIPLTARIFQGSNVLIYTAVRDEKKFATLEKCDTKVCVLPGANGQVDLLLMLRDLAQRGCNEVLLESGGTLNGAMLREALVDELLLYIAPQLLGDTARGMVRLEELTDLDQRIKLKWQDMRQVGNDLRIIAKVGNV
jgi:diaminohydroxyphosphoribosylaminopyrimidine deaminase / 5-amino-6-(5-phosphoribosylamino)uracil reductase